MTGNFRQIENLLSFKNVKIRRKYQFLFVLTKRLFDKKNIILRCLLKGRMKIENIYIRLKQK